MQKHPKQVESPLLHRTPPPDTPAGEAPADREPDLLPNSAAPQDSAVPNGADASGASVPPADPLRSAQGEVELSRLARVTEDLTRVMEKTRIAEYVDYLEHPGRLLLTNFLIGIARGLGSTIGLALVLAVLFFIIQKLIMLNLPGISDFISDLIDLIRENYDLMRR